MRFKSLVSLILAFCLVLTPLVFDMTAGAASTSELEAELAQIEQKIKDNKEKLSEIANDKSKQSQYLKTLQSQISETQRRMSNLERQVGLLDKEVNDISSEIEGLNTQISALTDSIAQTEANIVSIEAAIVESYSTVSQRLRASYMTGEDSTLKILLGADSISTFLTRLEFMKRVAENDKKMIDSFKKQATELKAAKSQLEEEKLTVQASRDELNTKKETLKTKQKQAKEKASQLKQSVADYETQYKECEEYIANLNRDSSAYKDYIAQLEKDKRRAEAEIDSIIAANTKPPTTTQEHETLPSDNTDPSVQINPNVGNGEFMWPLGSANCYISSYFGARKDPFTGASENHGAIDITGSGIYGKPIYASKSGTVIGWAQLNYSYGHYLIIDHGDGFVTLYAHCSKLVAQKGDYVVKGQVIAYVGSTGRSSGPHLHFEMRKNGTRVDPLNYVRKP